MEDVLPVIVFLLFVFGSAIKKVLEAFGQQKNENQERTVRPQTNPRQPSQREAPREMQEDLMRKLQEALGGASQNEKEQRETGAAPPPLPNRKPAHMQKEKTESQRYKSTRATKPEKIKPRMQMPIKPMRQRAEMSEYTFDHLAVIQSPAELQRAIIAQEILGPPRSKRPWNRIR